MSPKRIDSLPQNDKEKEEEKKDKEKEEKEKNEEEELCAKCDVELDGNMIRCDHCLGWFHSKCVGLNDNSFAVVKEIEQLFFCKRCKIPGKRLFELEKQVSSLGKRFDGFEREMNEKMKKLCDVVDTFVSSTFPPFPAFPTSQQDLSQLAPPREPLDINKIVVDTVCDAMEAEAKKVVAVLENFETDDDDDLATEVVAFVKKAGFEEKHVHHVRRSGPVVKSRTTGRDLPRIVKVTCDSEATRNELIKAVAKFTNKGRASKVYARPDRTYQQREKLRRLNKELEEKQVGEDYWYIDRNIYELKRNVTKFLPRA